MKKLRDFSRQQMHKIANDYANFPLNYSAFVEDYSISKSTFYNIIEKAIIEHIVDVDTVEKIRKRAISNATKKCENANVDAIYLHYENLLQKRHDFIFSKKERKRIITEFINKDTTLSKTNFCKEQCISIELLDKVLIAGICYKEISNKMYEKIKKDSLIYNNYSENVLRFFEELESIRNSIDDTKIDFNRIYNELYILSRPKISVENDNDNNENEKITETDEYGNIIDDGYSILD